MGLYVMFNLLYFFSPSFSKKQIIGENKEMAQNTKFKFDDWGPTFRSVAFLTSVLDGLWLSLGEEAFVGGEAPDPPVVTMDGERTSIRRFIKGAFR